MALAACKAGGGAIGGLLTTVTETYERVSMHGLRVSLLRAQAASMGLPLCEVRIPPECPNEVYAERMGRAVQSLMQNGVDTFAFGDLFLQDVRSYREAQFESVHAKAEFPLWGQNSARLARQFLNAGFAARICCLDTEKLSPAWCGMAYDDAFLAALPAGVDPCGENGEFHTFVTNGPIFRSPIAFEPGEVVRRGRFAFADFLPL